VVDVQGYRSSDGSWVRGHRPGAPARPNRSFNVGGYVVVAAFWLLLVVMVIAMLRHG
jgi:hypothetical protein